MNARVALAAAMLAAGLPRDRGGPPPDGVAPRVLSAQRRGVTAVRFGPRGRWVAASGLDGTVRIWDAASGSPIRALRTGMPELYDLSVSPGGDRVAVVGPAHEVRVLDAASGRVVRRWPHLPTWCSVVAYSPDGARLAAGCVDGSARVWDARSGALLATLGGSRQPGGTALAWAPDGQRLATAGATIRLWNTRTWAADGVLSGHGESVRAVAFSADGRHLASASLDRTVRIWNVGRAAAERVLRPEGMLVPRDTGWATEPLSMPQLAVAYPPRGEGLASAGSDRAVRLWRAASDTAATVLRGHTMSVTTLAFSPDGVTLASGGLDGTVRLWRADVSEPRPRP